MPALTAPLTPPEPDYSHTDAYQQGYRHGQRDARERHERAFQAGLRVGKQVAPPSVDDARGRVASLRLALDCATERFDAAWAAFEAAPCDPAGPMGPAVEAAEALEVAECDLAAVHRELSQATAAWLEAEAAETAAIRAEVRELTRVMRGEPGPKAAEPEPPLGGSLPLPEGWWRMGDGALCHRDARIILHDEADAVTLACEAESYRQARATVAGIEWVRHERAARARRPGGAS